MSGMKPEVMKLVNRPAAEKELLQKRFEDSEALKQKVKQETGSESSLSGLTTDGRLCAFDAANGSLTVQETQRDTQLDVEPEPVLRNRQPELLAAFRALSRHSFGFLSRPVPKKASASWAAWKKMEK